jgi:hypothetical protein
MLRVIEEEYPVTMLPAESVTVTTGWVVKAVLRFEFATPEGWVVKVRLAAVPGPVGEIELLWPGTSPEDVA